MSGAPCLVVLEHGGTSASGGHGGYPSMGIIGQQPLLGLAVVQVCVYVVLHNIICVIMYIIIIITTVIIIGYLILLFKFFLSFLFPKIYFDFI